ncbi:MAG TPA: tryptophan synthase subunit alpha [Bacteroidales bacterium]|nr:tryptophan synthase subunit alpha [Bacteroidales bacterium]HPM87416.1 tryptophan synthase subunit alpha [Bacteroidales bacterium]HQM69901.1 tryptophan synthase subunit alpha [Bacteroidales bacterium]
MNRIDKLFHTKKNNVLSIFFTAGYPLIDSTTEIIKFLADSGTDMIEIGMPFSDPLADGPLIQRSSETALKNGMSVKLLFDQLADIRKTVTIPLLLMGYLNPVLKFGMDNFCNKCAATGIDGVILPDLPPDIYVEKYSGLFEKYGIYNILLITPQTEPERIKMIDSISRGFIYMVSSSSTTGIKGGFSEDQKTYFRRIKEMNLSNPLLIGFGISDSGSFDEACKAANGAIIGSSFIKMFAEDGADSENIRRFIDSIKGDYRW